MVDAHTKVEIVLSKDEIPVYDTLARTEDVDPSKFRNGQRVNAPLFHWVDITVAFITVGTRQSPDTDEATVEDMYDSADSWTKAAGGIINKVATEADDDELRHLHALFEDDPRDVERFGFAPGAVGMSDALLDPER